LKSEKFSIINYPNPFNPVTKIMYNLPEDAKVNLTIYDISGREVKKLIKNEYKTAGIYISEFNGLQLSSGIYFYRIVIEGKEKYIVTKKMILLK
jgi:hypothetical protein